MNVIGKAISNDNLAISDGASMSLVRRMGEERVIVALCLLTDLLIFWLMLNVATLTRLHTVHAVDLMALQRDRIMCLLLFAVAAAVAGAYNPSRLTDRFDSMYFAGIGLFFAGVLEFLSVAVLPRDWLAISRRELALGVVLTALPLAMWRFWAAGVFQRFESLSRSFLVVGKPEDEERLGKWFSGQGEAVDARYVDGETLISAFQETGEESELTKDRKRDAIICCAEDREALLDILEYCELHCRRTYLYPSVDDTFLFQHTSLQAVGGLPLIEVANQNPSGAYVRLKRVMDFSAALVALVIAAPIYVPAMILVALTSPGGVFYTQERIGKNGKTFNIYKLRTMVANAEAKTGPKWAEKNDARVTPVGKFLRKHRIDEIPQLINVLKGDMSLVGPRPERPHFHEEFSQDLPLFRRRLVVRPGLTSLSHVLGSYSSDPADRLRYDLVYIGSLSLFNDLKVIFSTIRVVLGAKGAQ